MFLCITDPCSLSLSCLINAAGGLDCLLSTLFSQQGSVAPTHLLKCASASPVTHREACHVPSDWRLILKRKGRSFTWLSAPKYVWTKMRTFREGEKLWRQGGRKKIILSAHLCGVRNGGSICKNDPLMCETARVNSCTQSGEIFFCFSKWFSARTSTLAHAWQVHRCGSTELICWTYMYESKAFTFRGNTRVIWLHRGRSVSLWCPLWSLLPCCRAQPPKAQPKSKHWCQSRSAQQFLYKNLLSCCWRFNEELDKRIMRLVI